MSPLFLKHQTCARSAPNGQPDRVAMNVTPSERQRAVIDNQPDALEFNPDPNLSAEIRTHLWLRRNAMERGQ